MKWLSDTVLNHLCKVADWPELHGTRYEVIEKIGQGGMGSVFLARDRELDRPVALKVQSASAENSDARARMVKEARILARMEHPSIVPVHDSGVLPDGRFFYAMKLVRGKRLDEQVSGTTSSPSLEDRLRLFQKICDAVAFAHAHGVIHRDLKPQNIMLGAFGEVHVMDWGVAKEVEGSPPSRRESAVDGEVRSGHTANGAILGTPGYMAPEQERGEVDLVDERADVYALGAILYFLLTGRAPVRHAALAGSATPPSLMPPRGYNRSIPRPLEAVCLKALATDRAERYGSVAELNREVADFLARRRIRAYPEGLLELTRRLGTKYRTVLALIFAYLIMRILLLVFLRS